MIKNPQFLKALECQSGKIEKRGDWYKNADALFETAMSLSPSAVKNGGVEII